MIVELGVGLLAVGALGYTIHWQRKRMELVKIHKKQIERLKWLKRNLERDKQMWLHNFGINIISLLFGKAEPEVS